MIRISLLCVAFLAICGAVPSLAQTPAANNITCSSGTACKKAAIAVFTTTGGAAKSGQLDHKSIRSDHFGRRFGQRQD
jgi:hypothetical protein